VIANRFEQFRQFVSYFYCANLFRIPSNTFFPKGMKERLRDVDALSKPFVFMLFAVAV
jgi:hypothetical protein